jgi:hypothetical protein
MEKSIKAQTTADKRDRQKERINADFFSAKSAEKRNYLVCVCLRESAVKGKEY